jgi:HK97 family phage prohead protease
MELELRILPSEVELREAEGGARTLSGYAVKWEQLSEKMGYFFRFCERFRKGAFMDSLRDDAQKAYWNHNTDMVLGSTKNKTLRLNEDDVGLHFEIDIPDTTWGEDAYKTIKRGDVDGVSFAFRMLGEEWDESDPDNVVRTVTKAKIAEVSPTPNPAYPQSEVQARSVEESYKAFKEAQSGKPGEIDGNRHYLAAVETKIKILGK